MEIEEKLLELMHSEKQYPPRLEMTVQLLNQIQQLILSVFFEGCATDGDSPKFQFILPIGMISTSWQIINVNMLLW